MQGKVSASSDTVSDCTKTIDVMNHYARRLSFLLTENILTADDLSHGGEVNAMIEKKIRSYVDERHHAAISYLQKRNRYKTNVNDKGVRRTIEAATIERLYEKLFDFYTGISHKEPTLQDAFAWLLEHKKTVEGITDKSINRNRDRWQQFTTEELAATPLSAVTEELLCKSIRQSCDAWAVSHGRQPGLDGVRLYLQQITAIYTRTLPARGTLIINPAAQIKAEYFKDCCKTTKKVAENKCMEPSDVQLLKDYCSQNPCASAYGVRLVSCTGLRVGELCALRWSDVTDNWLHVHQQLLRKETADGHANGYEIVPWTKNERGEPCGGRDVPLLYDAPSVLTEIKAAQLRAGTYRADGYVLALNPMQPDEPLHRDTYIEYFRRTCRRLEIKLTNNHSLRMYVNSYIYAPAGLTTAERALFLGHTPSTNERFYTFAGRAARDAGAEKLYSYTGHPRSLTRENTHPSEKWA